MWLALFRDLSHLNADIVHIVGVHQWNPALAVIVKLLADRQIKVAAEVVSYLVPRIERSFVAASRIVAAIDEAALAENRSVTVALACQVLEGEKS
jgi:chromosomal replication initiation ATPase DnaA